MSALKKAVFLDRDGVLCEDTDYITSFEKLHIYPFAKKAVEQIHKKGYLVIVVTNQSGVARGYLAEEMESDIQTGKAAGTKTVFVKGRKCSEQPDFVVSDVWEFAKNIKV